MSKRINKLNIIYLLLACCFLLRTLCFAEEQLTVGVAANFMLPFHEIAARYEKEFKVRINATFTSTGNLYAQIKNGAPYDLLLTADEATPRRLLEEGLAAEPFIYARGKAVLWTANRQICASQDWQKALKMPEIKKISIAKPETAPYGAASVTALRAVGMEDLVKDRLVFAQDVAQSFQYAHTESVDAAFCALSSALSEEGKKGCYFEVDQAPLIVQAGCVIKGSKSKGVAEDFAGFVCSPTSQAIIHKYGYQ
ncbi:Molybdenum ABC transporter, periplasmic molybdate-binding protein [uncultured Desulfobacterium sp.]|uniref:Molybdenum ABC transporter, periplasmic molybdate-binding protein n=1 Tax=uncultured Desulfobacterium sp. TaxID=201089 RepID=A0A445MXC3_9BACT|nr:Molybdenum ABC transporter, periplasmic molybdate-binding protein [uncultured Desulfobacterium sp.]